MLVSLSLGIKIFIGLAPGALHFGGKGLNFDPKFSFFTYVPKKKTEDDLF